MTPEREAQMREMFRKFTADQANKRAIERLAYRQDVAMFVWLACARALEPMVRDAERYRAIREFGSKLKLYVYEDPKDFCSGDWVYKPDPELVDAEVDVAMSAALEDGNADV